MLTTGASVPNYMSVALESRMPVALVWSARWRSVWVQLSVTLLISGKGEGVDFFSRLGLKFSV